MPNPKKKPAVDRYESSRSLDARAAQIMDEHGLSFSEAWQIASEERQKPAVKQTECEFLPFELE